MTAPWWKGAVVHQVYPRSFCDSDGDGIGDLPGLLSKLGYIQALGVDAVWLSPVHPSPNRDFGYDVSDYEDIAPEMGGMSAFNALLGDGSVRNVKYNVTLAIWQAYGDRASNVVGGLDN